MQPKESHITLRPSRSRQFVRTIAFLLLIATSITIVISLVGPQVGLGLADRSLMYVWFGLSRTELFLTGVTGGGIAVYVGIATYMRQWKMFVANTCLLLAAVVVSLLILEVIARVVDGKPILALRNWLGERNALLTTQTLNDYDPLLGWVLKPNQRIATDQPASSFTTGPYGIRLSRPDGGVPSSGAVLAVGDSYTAGSEVGDRHTWPAQLETIIGHPVINAATGGWATDQIVLRTESLLSVLRPSIVIVSFYENDIERAAYKIYSGGGKPFFTVENDELIRHNIPVKRYTGRIQETPLLLVIPSYSYLVMFVADRLGWSNWWQAFSTSYVNAGNDPAAVTCVLLRRLQSKLANLEIKFMLVLQYGGAVTPTKSVNSEAVVACARRAGIDTLDLFDDLLSVHDNSYRDYIRLWASFDGHKVFGHMSSLGNRLVAERIAARLRSGPAAK